LPPLFATSVAVAITRSRPGRSSEESEKRGEEVARRYLLAKAGFAVALIWTGIGLTSGFECLLVFMLVSSVPVARRATRPRARHDTRSDESGEWPQLAERL
jgi:hypothetical protein